MQRLGELTWEELRQLQHQRVVALLPMGAIEAHGPHLPLETDVIIATAMAEKAAALIEDLGFEALLLPCCSYTPSPFAAAFSGTVSIRTSAAADILTDIGCSLARAGLRVLAIANVHLDPANLQAIARAEEQLKVLCPELRVVFPNLTRHPWRRRLGEEFNSGACHAGRFETSVVLACRADLVRQELCNTLPDNPCSLSVAIQNGIEDFVAAGGPRAYFGSPSAATADEGRRIIDILGGILCDAICDS